MLYDIYFHDDFDGRASAAVMLDFLRSRGDDILHYVPMDFDIQEQYLKDDFFTVHKFFRGKRNPAVVVDFLYHPKAAFWFDHHTTAFKRDDWKKKFHKSKFYQWHPDYFSCCHATVDALKKDFGYRPPAHIRELAKWLDVIDGARFASAKQTILKKEPALQIDAFVVGSLKPGGNKKFIASLTERPLQAIVKDRVIQESVQKFRHETKIGLAYYKRRLKIYGAIAVIELPPGKFNSLRFASFYFHPELSYVVSVRKMKRSGLFKLGLGVNPWRRKKNKVHIGEFLQTHFPGAGGHRDVGGAEFKIKKDAENAVQEIVKAFNG
jgi:hypothetical protein